MVFVDTNDLRPRRKFLSVKSSWVLMNGPQDDNLVSSKAGHSLIKWWGSKSCSSQNLQVVGVVNPIRFMCTGKTLCPVIHWMILRVMFFGCDKKKRFADASGPSRNFFACEYIGVDVHMCFHARYSTFLTLISCLTFLVRVSERIPVSVTPL